MIVLRGPSSIPALVLVPLVPSPPLAYVQACKNAPLFLMRPVFAFVEQSVAPKLEPFPFRLKMMPWNLVFVWRLPHQTIRPPLSAPEPV